MMTWKKLSKQDVLKEVANGSVDLSKGVVGEEVKKALANEYLSQFAKEYLPEIAKALTGTTGKLLIAIIFKQFDQTSKELATLKKRWAEHDKKAWESARVQFEEAIEYPEGSPDEVRFRQQLFNEARVALVQAADIWKEDVQRHIQCLHSAFICACEVPGGHHHAKKLLQAFESVVLDRNNVLRKAQYACEQADTKARFYTVQVKTGETKIYQQRGYQPLDGGVIELDVYRDETRQWTDGPAFETAEKWKQIGKELGTQIEFAKQLISENQERLKLISEAAG